MNYRHAFHAGNFADVLKHAVLALCVEHLKTKPSPFRIIDTHAGLGLYDLTSEAAQRSPEWRDGIARLLDADAPPEAASALAPLLSVVRTLNPQGGLALYPGSPEICARLSRGVDRLHLCELHPADAETLAGRYARRRNIIVEARDGYAALPALLPPSERRGLVLIDPPFESRDELSALASAMDKALTRWPTGSYAIWRPLKDIAAVDRFDADLAQRAAAQGLAPDRILRADMWVRDLRTEGKLGGAGVILVNPPWTLEAALRGLLPWLTQTLAQGAGEGWRLDRGV